MKQITLNYNLFNKSEADEYLAYFSQIENVEIKNQLSFGISEQIAQIITVLAPAGVITALQPFFKLYFDRNKGKTIKIVREGTVIELKGHSTSEIKKILNLLGD